MKERMRERHQGPEEEVFHAWGGPAKKNPIRELGKAFERGVNRAIRDHLRRSAESEGQGEGEEWTEERVREKLQNAGLDLATFGVGKALSCAQIAAEMNRGESYFVEDDYSEGVRRLVSMVQDFSDIGKVDRCFTSALRKIEAGGRLP